jgi:hypothetical protein
MAHDNAADAVSLADFAQAPHVGLPICPLDRRQWLCCQTELIR